MQVHYNLLNRPAGSSDRPGIRLRLAPGDARLTPLRTQLLPAPVELPCPGDSTARLCDRTLAVLDVTRRFGLPAGATVAGLTLLCRPDGRPAPGPTQSCDHRVTEPGRVYCARRAHAPARHQRSPCGSTRAGRAPARCST